MSGLLNQIYQVPFFGDSLCYVSYAITRLIIPLAAWLSGGQRVKCGTSIFWIPRSAKKGVLDGVELLHTKDPEMFLRLTTQQRLIIVYTHNTSSPNNGTRIYGLHKRFIEMGPEGIACFLVQSIFFYEASPSVNQCRLNDRELAAIKVAPRKTLEWMSQHSFHPGLINTYRRVAEKWEQSERFQMN
jgi:hypothetical protein